MSEEEINPEDIQKEINELLKAQSKSSVSTTEEQPTKEKEETSDDKIITNEDYGNAPIESGEENEGTF